MTRPGPDLRPDYPAAPYEPDADLVEDDRRRQLGLEPCRALVHERQTWWLSPWGLWAGRMGGVVPQSSPFGRHTWRFLGGAPQSLAAMYWDREPPF